MFIEPAKHLADSIWEVASASELTELLSQQLQLQLIFLWLRISKIYFLSQTSQHVDEGILAVQGNKLQDIVVSREAHQASNNVTMSLGDCEDQQSATMQRKKVFAADASSQSLTWCSSDTLDFWFFLLMLDTR